MIDIKGLDKAKVLKALHDKSKAQCLSYLSLKVLSLEDCQKIVSESNGDLCFDYLAGKVLKVNISRDEFNPWGYDRDNGAGAAQRAIESIS